MKILDVSCELWREYDFEDCTIRIDAPLKLYISESGTHRVFDGVTVTYLPSCWRALRWEPKNKSTPVLF